MNEKSCLGCKFLYSQDLGYSNYTVTDTEICCALHLNSNLPAEEPYDWKREDDNWPKTKDSRCDRYAVGEMIHLDVDGDVTVESETSDPEVIEAFKS
jgi:hypothetical protein